MKVMLFFLCTMALPLQGGGFGAPPDFKLAIARVELVGGRQVNGYLYAINDSSLEISPTGFMRSLDRTGQSSKILYVKDIRNLKLRKRGSVEAGAFLGGILGAVLGGVIGNSLYKPCDPAIGWTGLSRCDIEIVNRTGAAAIGIGLGTIPGTGIGILIGSRYTIFQISGSQHVFEKQRKKLAFYLPKAP